MILTFPLLCPLIAQCLYEAPETSWVSCSRPAVLVGKGMGLEKVLVSGQRDLVHFWWVAPGFDLHQVPTHYAACLKATRSHTRTNS